MTTDEIRNVLNEAFWNMQRMHECEADEQDVKNCMSRINALLARTDWEIVPKEPTQAMDDAGYESICSGIPKSATGEAMMESKELNPRDMAAILCLPKAFEIINGDGGWLLRLPGKGEAPHPDDDARWLRVGQLAYRMADALISARMEGEAMTSTTQEELPPHDYPPIQYPDSLGHLSLADEDIVDLLCMEYATKYGKQCISTLKAENERLRGEFEVGNETRAIYLQGMAQANARAALAQSQAAAMAGLLAEAKEVIIRAVRGEIFPYAEFENLIDAALAAWKEKQ